MKRWFGLLAVGLVAFSITGAEAITLSYATEPIRLHASPGQVVNRRFLLGLGKEEKDTRFRVKVEDWWLSEDGTQSFYRPPGTLARSCAPWIRLNPVEAVIKGGDSLDVRLTIQVPEDVKPGGYWCALTIDEVPDPLAPRLEGVGVRFQASLSVGVYVFVGPLDQRVRITAIDMAPDRMVIALRNDGNTPLAAEGRFEFLRPGTSEPKATVPIPRRPLLPEPINTARILCKLPSPDELPSGRYIVRAVLDVGLDHYIGAQKEMEIRREAPDEAVRQ